MLLQYEEPPDFLADDAMAALAPEPEDVRVGRFLDGAVEAGLLTPGKKEGTWKKGRRVLKPDRFSEDFAAVGAELGEYRKLLAECRKDAPVCRARLAPKVTAAELRERAGAELTAGSRAVLVGLFDISLRYYSEKQVLDLFVVELDSGEARPELAASLRSAVGVSSEPLPAEALDAAALDAGLATLRKLAEERGEGLYTLVKDEVARERAARRATMEGYFEGLEEEYQKEERRMYYHLYYFDQQEKLAAKRAADLAERKALVAGQERYYQIETAIRLESLAFLELPVFEAKGKLFCGLSGTRL